MARSYRIARTEYGPKRHKVFSIWGVILFIKRRRGGKWEMSPVTEALLFSALMVAIATSPIWVYPVANFFGYPA